jgi:ferredoxin
MNATSGVVTILIDDRLKQTGYGLPVDELANRLRDEIESIKVAIVGDLERNLPEAVPDAASASRVVLALASGRDVQTEVQQFARAAGIDQLGVRVARLGVFSCRVADPDLRLDHAMLMLHGEVARAMAYGGSGPRNLKPMAKDGGGLGILGLLPELEYQPVPTVRRRNCHAPQGCQECANNCPHGALSIADGHVRLNKSRCTSCGICLSACPHEAVNFPTANPDELDSQIAAMIDESRPGPDARGILFICANTIRKLGRYGNESGTEISPNWLPVEVPCLGMLTVPWILAPLRLGAGAVGMVHCGSCCRSGEQDRLRQRVSYCQRLLRKAWSMPELVSLLSVDDHRLTSYLRDDAQFPGFDFQPMSEPAFAYRQRTDVVVDIAAADGAGVDWSFEHPASPFAMINATEGCTLCGSCADTCPTGALKMFDDRESETALTFDSRSCVACEQCLPVCPEQSVLSLTHITDLAWLSTGRTTLHRDTIHRCERCGKPITSTKVMNRIAELLGDDHAATMNIVSRYCVDCRGTVH